MIINKRLENHTINFNILFEVKKQQLFFIPKEESQMFTGKEYNFTPGVNYPNNVYYETVNNSLLAQDDSTLNASWNATDYIGSTTILIPSNLNLQFVDLILTQLSTGREIILDPTVFLIKISNGLYNFVLPPNFLNIQFVDEDDTDVVKQYGSYLLKIIPKSFSTPVVNMIAREQYPSGDLADALNTFRRKTYETNYNAYINLPWNFEVRANQSGRLLGSIAEIYDSSLNYKTTKIIAENDFRGLDKNVQLVLSPDTVGYDAPSQIIGVGDVVKIFPRETYFEPINIQFEYVSDNEIQSQAYRYLMNDVLRDVTTGTYEVYDENGVTINPDGTFDGSVIQTYQVQQFGQYELRKRLRNE